MTYVVKAGGYIYFSFPLSSFRTARTTPACAEPSAHISHLEHADDIVIISHSLTGLQSHLNDFADWCRTNFLELTAKKSSVMIFGAFNKSMRHLTFDADSIPFHRTEKYVGLTFTSTLRNIFGEHYRNKADVAQACAHGGLFGHHLGRGNIPIQTAVQLYAVPVDCHLIHGTDVCPDVDDASLQLLERNWASTRCDVDAFFYVCRISNISYSSRPPIAHLALLVSEDLYDTHNSSWLADLDLMVSSFAGQDTPVPALQSLTTLSAEIIDISIRSIKRAQHAALDAKVEDSISLYLLHDRLEPQQDGSAKHITLALRQYLTRVSIADHRFAMSRILLGAHKLHGVHSSTSQATPQLQQCRMCHNHLETPEHMLLQCTADNHTVLIRQEFFTHLSQSTHPRFMPVSSSDNAALFWLKAVMFKWNTAPVVARWIYHTSRHWKALSLLPSEVHADIRHQHDDGDDG
ncbi:hypothetical protein BDZ89DRAFT_1134863 [Hymenopellis radicata]|nr:hypothetical protein BDZ89DRAFT_1134863 [Hymenopellis radicata]